jgi:DNA processing protein
MADLARPGSGRGSAANRGHPDPTTTRLLDALSSRSSRGLDEIAKRSGLSISASASALARLELDGLVRETERGWQRVGARA